MIIVNSDIISVTPTIVDEKKSLVGLDMSESLFDYDLLLGDAASSNSSNKSNEKHDTLATDSLFESLFHEEEEGSGDNLSNSSSLSSSPQKLDGLIKRPKIMQWGPHHGQELSTIISIVFEHTEETGPMKIVFGSLTVETAQQQHIMSNNNSVWITLAASVPQFADTRSDSNQVQISVCLFDNNDPDLAIDTWDVGKFNFTVSNEDVEHSKHRKRALSCEPSEHAQKKAADIFNAKNDEQIHDIQSEESQLLKLLGPYEPLMNIDNMESSHTSHLDSSPSSATWSSSPIHQQNFSTSQNPSPPFSNTANLMLQQSMVNCRPLPNHAMYSVNNQQQQHSYLPHKQSMYRNYIEMQQNQRNPQQDFIMQQQQQQHHLLSQAMNNYMNNPMNNYHNTSNAYYSKPTSNTVLYSMPEHQHRHSIQRSHPYHVEQSRRASAPSSTSYSITNSNSCALNQAHLKLNGDLMDMVLNWSIPEWQSGRRLVQFWRHTNNNAEGNLSLVECGFDPMDQQAYHQQRMRDNVAAVAAAAAAAVAVSNSSPTSTTHLNNNTRSRPTPIVISCIYWRERNDYFITSVDCIYLLENLIGIQFTVEEKNRIRRNLEGFRPLTVSKCKSECADFFKLIMSFPHPKPRNIEKDVKVFSWKTLPHALRKIIKKYTPSYTTTTPLEPIHQRSMSTSSGSNVPNGFPSSSSQIF